DRRRQAGCHCRVDHRGSAGGDQVSEVLRTVGGWMRHILTVLAFMIGTTSLGAQGDPQCNLPNPDATAACNTAVDAIRAFHPLAGMIVSGGNPVIGTATTLGGIGHLSVTARVNAIKAALPNPDSANSAS